MDHEQKVPLTHLGTSVCKFGKNPRGGTDDGGHANEGAREGGTHGII